MYRLTLRHVTHPYYIFSQKAELNVVEFSAFFSDFNTSFLKVKPRSLMVKTSFPLSSQVSEGQSQFSLHLIRFVKVKLSFPCVLPCF